MVHDEKTVLKIQIHPNGGPNSEPSIEFTPGGVLQIPREKISSSGLLYNGYVRNNRYIYFQYFTIYRK